MENFSLEEFIKDKKPAIRPLKELLSVLRTGHNPELPQETVVYEMYRDLSRDEDRETIKRHGLRFDVTIIHPNILANELTKTHGHYHKDNMLEVSEVIQGNAWFVLQKYATNPRFITEAYIVHVKEGEKIVYPPGFGHITINPDKETELITSNWISAKTESDYIPYQQLQGACYYFYKNERDEIMREENKKYKDVPALIQLVPKEIPEMNITFDKSLYSMIKTPGKLDFLTRPEDYKEIFTIKNCYTKI